MRTVAQAVSLQNQVALLILKSHRGLSPLNLLIEEEEFCVVFGEKGWPAEVIDPRLWILELAPGSLSSRLGTAT